MLLCAFQSRSEVSPEHFSSILETDNHISKKMTVTQAQPKCLMHKTIIPALHGHHVGGGRGGDMTDAHAAALVPSAECWRHFLKQHPMKWKVVHKGSPTLITSGDATNRENTRQGGLTRHYGAERSSCLCLCTSQSRQNRMKYHTDTYAHAQYEIFIKNIKLSIKLV